jgi:hypothetical protein
LYGVTWPEREAHKLMSKQGTTVSLRYGKMTPRLTVMKFRDRPKLEFQKLRPEKGMSSAAVVKRSLYTHVALVNRYPRQITLARQPVIIQ